MANKTNNYKLPKPEVDDFYDISEYNKTMDMLDDSLTEMDEKKLDKNGDASEAVTEFEQEILRENIESGEKLSTTFGKVKKWFSEMKDVAFSGHAKDVATDAAHRFVSDAEKSSWNGKVGANGGDISETVIGTLESIDSKYPVPTYGESAKVFMGKVKKYIEETKPLVGDIVLYVATTGSDIAGNGTDTKPYKTIQKAVDSVPKCLNGYTATINVEAGTYTEDVYINGFRRGNLNLYSVNKNTLIDTCKVSSISVFNCGPGYIRLNGFNLITATRNSLQVGGCNGVYIYYCQSTIPTPTQTGIQCYESICAVSYCKFANKNHGASFVNCTAISEHWAPGSGGNVIGVSSINGSKVTLIGAQATGTSDRYQMNGGVYIYENGTQISEAILSGLSCTWAALGGGYIRNGNLNGPAMVTVQLAISTGGASSLTAGTEYQITGFPRPFSNTSVAFSPQSIVDNCYVDIWGILHLWFRVNINAPYGMLVNCTYRVNE